MKVSVQTIIKGVAEKSRARVCEIVLTLGSSKTEIMKYHGRRHSTIFIAMDNPNDLAAWASLCSELNVDTISLGRGHTAWTLSQLSDKEIQGAILKVASMNATSGCGASPLIGYLAAEARVRMSDFKMLLRRVSATIRKITNGAPDMLVLRICGSYCGGTCAGAFRTIATAFTNEFIRFGVPVQVELDLLGSVTFAENSDRCRTTAAAVLPFAIAFLIDRTNPKFARVTNHLMLGELPPINNKAERDRLVLVEEVALTSPQFLSEFDRIRPNHSTSGLFGNVSLKETDFFSGLDLFRDIAPEVASFYLTRLNEEKQSIVPDSSQINQLDFIDRSTPLSPKSISAIVESIYDFSPEALLEATKKADRRYRYQLFITMTRGDRYDATKLRGIFAAPSNTLGETISNAKLIASFIERLASTALTIGAEVENIAREIEIEEGNFKKILTLLTHKRLSRRTRIRETAKLHVLATNIRSLTNDLLDQHAANFEVNNALWELRSQQASIDGRLQVVMDMLRSFLPDGSIESHDRMIIPITLEGVFPELIRATRQARQHQAEVLRLCAGLVTIHGLAKIVQAPMPTVDAIADAIVTGTPAYEGVPHGGVSQQDAPDTIYSLTRVEDYLENELTSQIKTRDPNSKVIFVHTLAGGANVLRFRFRFPQTIEEILSGVFPFDLQEAIDSPHAALSFPGDRKYAQHAGVFIGDKTFELKPAHIVE